MVELIRQAMVLPVENFSTGRVKHLRPSNSDDLADRDQGRVDRLFQPKVNGFPVAFRRKLRHFLVATFQVLHHHSAVLVPKMTSSTT